MKMKKTLAVGTLVVGLTPILGMVACTDDKEKKEEIALIVSTKTNPYFVNIIKAAKKAAQKLNTELAVYDSNDKGSVELQNVKTAINKGAKVIILNVVNSAVKGAAEYAKTKGVKVIAIDRSIKGFEAYGAVYTDNEMAAKNLAKKVWEKAKSLAVTHTPSDIYQLQGISGESNGIARDKGFKRGFGPNADNNDKWNHIDNSGNKNIVRADYKIGTAKTKVQAALTKKGGYFNIIFAENDQMAAGAVEAIKFKKGETNKDKKILDDYKIIIAGFDAESIAINHIKNGNMFATVKQNATKMAQLSLDLALKFLKKKYNNARLDAEKMEANNLIQIDGIVLTKEDLTAKTTT